METITCTCINKIRDKSGNIKAYLLQDNQGQSIQLASDELKRAIFYRQLHVVNLKLSSDGKLIDNKEDTRQQATHAEQASNPRKKITDSMTTSMVYNNLLTTLTNIRDCTVISEDKGVKGSDSTNTSVRVNEDEFIHMCNLVATYISALANINLIRVWINNDIIKFSGFSSPVGLYTYNKKLVTISKEGISVENHGESKEACGMNLKGDLDVKVKTLIKQFAKEGSLGDDVVTYRQVARALDGAMKKLIRQEYKKHYTYEHKIKAINSKLSWLSEVTEEFSLLTSKGKKIFSIARGGSNSKFDFKMESYEVDGNFRQAHKWINLDGEFDGHTHIAEDQATVERVISHFLHWDEVETGMKVLYNSLDRLHDESNGKVRYNGVSSDTESRFCIFDEDNKFDIMLTRVYTGQNDKISFKLEGSNGLTDTISIDTYVEISSLIPKEDEIVTQIKSFIKKELKEKKDQTKK
jgi:hypothetical protein